MERKSHSKSNKSQSSLAKHGQGHANSVKLGLLTAVIACVVSSALTAFIISTNHSSTTTSSFNPVATSALVGATDSLVRDILAPPDVPVNEDIAFMNLACSPEMTSPAALVTDARAIELRLHTLQSWSTIIAETTTRNYHRYRENPQEYKNEAEWRLAMMRTVIGQDFRVKYDERLSSSALQNASNRQFFTNSHAIFLTGCLDDTRVGTCASLPVLYVAIGRRLGYPMYLVAAKGHLFARWDDGKGTRVNLETAGGDGFVSHPDDYYRTWPQPLSAREEKDQGYLKNLNSRESLAVFLSTRSAHLMANDQQQQAITAAIAAFRLAPALGGIADTLRLAVHGYQDDSVDKINRLQAMLAERDHPNPYDPESPTYNRHLLPRPGYIPGQVSFPQPPPNARGTNPSLLPSSNPYSPRHKQTGLASPY